MNESQEFKGWLKKHHNHFSLQRYGSDEIARIALANGFSMELVCSHITNHLVILNRCLTFWESPLADKWMRVVHYERGIDE